MKGTKTIFIRAAVLILALCFIVPLSSCFDPNYDWDLPKRDPVILPPSIFDMPESTEAVEIVEALSDGLILRLSDDGTHYIAAGCRDKTLEKLEIPESYNGIPVTEIASSAFAGMKDLKSISIPDSILRVGKDAFYGCISLPYKIDSINGLQYLGNEKSSHYVLLDRKRSSVTSILSIHNTTVVIADGALENYLQLTLAHIPASVRTIGDYAFRGCTGLEEINFQGNVEYIGEQAFASCRELKGAFLPDSVKEVGASAFEGCTALRTASTGNGVKVIENNTFAGCTALQSMMLGAAVNHIKEAAFLGCTALREIPLPVTVQYVDSTAFADCNSLVYDIYEGGKYLSGTDGTYFLLYEVPNSDITSLPLHPDTAVVAYGLFGSLEKLSIIYIKENNGNGKNFSVANNCIYRLNDYNTIVMGMNRSRPYASSGELVICDYAFYGCDLGYMEKLGLGRNVVKIGDYAFANSRGAESIRFFSDVRSIGEGAFMNCRLIRNIYFNGTKVESIGDYAFYRCGLSGDLELPKGLKKLGASAFEGCTEIENVTLPDTLEEIGNCAFADCSSLRELLICPSTVSVGVDMIASTSAAIKYNGSSTSWFNVANRDAMKALEPYTVYCTDGNVNYN